MLRFARPLLPALAVVACTPDAVRSTARPGAASASPASVPAPSTAQAVPESPPLVSIERLVWEKPPLWRDLGVSLQGVTKAHFQAFIEDPRVPVPEIVEVFVVHHEGARGETADARTADAVAREAEPFTKLDWKKSETRVVDGRKVVILELHGTLRELVPVPPDYERAPVARPGRAQITAFVPTKTFPYRVAIHGREDLVDRVRDDFFHFVDSIRVEDERAP